MALPLEPILERGFLSAHAQPTLQIGDLELRPWELGDGPAIVLSGRLVGRVAVRDLDRHQAPREVSYWVLAGARGAGVARRSWQALTDWAASIGVHRLKPEHAVANQASGRVADAAGYEREGIHRKALRHAHGWHDTHLHARLS